MASWRRQIAEALAAPGAQGPWGRRIAEGATDVNGVTIGALGASGPWDRRLAIAAGLTAGAGSWMRKLAGGEAQGGSWARTAKAADTITGGGGPSPPGGLLFSANFAAGSYTVADAPAVVGDILVENTNWGHWNPATNIDSNGIVMGPGVGPVLANAFFTTASTTGITLTGVLTLGAQADSGLLWEMNDDPTYDAENAAMVQNATITVQDYDGAVTQDGPGAGNFGYALNLTPSRIAISVNGGAVLARDVPIVALTLVGLYPASANVAYLASMDGRALVAESALPGLSA